MTMLRRLLPLALLVPLVLSGCDSTDDTGDTFPLPTPPNHRASFVFTAGSLEANETSTAGPVTQLSQTVINDSRYGPEDVALARIQSGSVELQLDFPPGAENEVVIAEATLLLSASGLGEQVVARGTDITLATISTTAPPRQTLQVVNADITRYLEQESFTGTLVLDVAGAGSDPYQFTARFDVNVEVNV
jgi:hypothetical protein